MEKNNLSFTFSSSQVKCECQIEMLNEIKFVVFCFCFYDVINIFLELKPLFSLIGACSIHPICPNTSPN